MSFWEGAGGPGVSLNILASLILKHKHEVFSFKIWDKWFFLLIALILQRYAFLCYFFLLLLRVNQDIGNIDRRDELEILWYHYKNQDVFCQLNKICRTSNFLALGVNTFCVFLDALLSSLLPKLCQFWITQEKKSYCVIQLYASMLKQTDI